MDKYKHILKIHNKVKMVRLVRIVSFFLYKIGKIAAAIGVDFIRVSGAIVFCGENTFEGEFPFSRSILKLTSLQAQIKFVFLLLVVALACWTTIDAEGRVK